MKNTNNIENLLGLVTKYFNVDKIVNEKQGEKEVRKYYLTNHLAYLFFYNKNGFMHMGISRNGEYKPKDLLEPLKIVNSYINKIKAKTVLELGSGNGSNSAYLAKNNSEVRFFALDLSKKPLRRFRKFSNFKQSAGNYHNLNEYKDKSIDLIFAIETVCHSQNKKLVLEQAYKKLRKNGLLIIFDGYLNKDLEMLSNNKKLAVKLSSKAMAVESLENLKKFEEIVKKSGLITIKTEDLSSFVVPTIKRLQRRALKFYSLQLFTKLLVTILPYDLVKNSIAGLLLPPLVKEKICFYYLHILQKTND